MNFMLIRAGLSIVNECANIGESRVPFKTSVKYLGVSLDRTLSLQQHISSICRASFLELRLTCRRCCCSGRAM